MGRIGQVIILGAGASKSEGAPLQNELFKEFFQGIQSLKAKGVWSITAKTSIAITIFATFAFFAVRFLCYSKESYDASTKGN